MSNVLSDWRNALIGVLQTQFPTAEVRAGVRQGVSRDKDRINVFADPTEQTHVPGRIVVETPRLLVRYWKAFNITPPPNTPADPTPLEQARYDLEIFLRAQQNTLGVSGLWYFLVESTKIDEDPKEWGIETRLQGYTKNYAAIA